MKDYKKYFILNGTPEDIYNALTNAKMIEIWSGEPAIMSAEPGSEFSIYDGSITGKNLQFEENKLIVQQWDFEGSQEESIVTMKIFPHKMGTSLEVRHSNIPDDAYDNIVEGWENEYIAALAELFNI